MLYTLFTFANHKDDIILNFADDTTFVELITAGDKTAYRNEVTV